ncbi:hypothetical protein [Arthrobacter sp. GMC3]|uniref:hypothetical protein n=1 Tax=Arthrobacter sp. GMC3 TaxID=2058894 RepID=UPI0015E454A9|nr:hypothetical protein [Arthrobacter sp. GMC3]
MTGSQVVKAKAAGLFGDFAEQPPPVLLRGGAVAQKLSGSGSYSLRITASRTIDGTGRP